MATVTYPRITGVEDFEDELNTLEGKYVRTSRFSSIGSGTSGTITLPTNSTVVLDDFGGTVDAVVSTMSGGRPLFTSAVDGGGTAISATFDSSGNYTLSATPSAYPVALVYRVQQTLVDFDSTSSDILGPPHVSSSGAVGATWGAITGTLSSQTDLQNALDLKVDENATITGATKTKITYDSKGLVTSGADATTADIADSSNKRYVTDAQLVVIGNTSGTNTGDQDLSSYATTSYVDGKVSDTSYDATSWDGVTTTAPSKNAVRDKIQLLMPLAGGVFTGAVIESVSALTDAATIAVDATLGNIFTVTLAGNRTLGNPTGAVNGQKLIFRIRQDATGSRTLSYDTKFRFGTDVTSPTLTTTAAKTDYIGVIYHGADDKFDVIAVVKGL